MSLWDEVKKNVVDLYTVTSDKTTEITKVSSRRWDKFGISRDIERQFGELGNLVYTGLKEGREEVLQDPQVGVLMARIEALESELRQKESEIENIQEEHRARREAHRHASAEAGSTAYGTAEQQAGGPDLDPAEAAMADDGDDSDTEVLITDPVLEQGHEESAILVEPVDEMNEGGGEDSAPSVDETPAEDEEKPRQ